MINLLQWLKGGQVQIDRAQSSVTNARPHSKIITPHTQKALEK